MMGHQAHPASLFYYLRLEDQIPESHLLRLIHTHVDFRFVRQRLEPYYSAPGRPSTDPEVLVRLLLLGYLYRITSERRLRGGANAPRVSMVCGRGLRSGRAGPLNPLKESARAVSASRSISGGL